MTSSSKEYLDETDVYEQALEVVTHTGQTLREYLQDLLETLWSEGEGFSGKYGAEGNSDWDSMLCYDLAQTGLFGKKLDPDRDDMSRKYEKDLRDIIRGTIRYVFL